MGTGERELLTTSPAQSKGKSKYIFKRAKRKVEKVAGKGGKTRNLDSRPSLNPVSLAASEALYATRKTLRLSVSTEPYSRTPPRYTDRPHSANANPREITIPDPSATFEAETQSVVLLSSIAVFLDAYL